MKHSIRITAVRKDPPDLDRFAAALLALAIERVESGEAASNSEPMEQGGAR